MHQVFILVSHLIVEETIYLGVDSTFAKKMLGTHWSMRIWSEEDLWGTSYMCKEYPHLNMCETMHAGTDKMVTHFMFGGMAKVSLVFLLAYQVTIIIFSRTLPQRGSSNGRASFKGSNLVQLC